MGIRVVHSVGDLASDLRKMPQQARREFRETVRQGLIAGNTLARDYARSSAGAHGKHYPRSMTWEMHTSLFGASGTSISGEYGPERGRRQGGMSFEFGSRNQRPHLDLARSADIIGGSLAQEVRGVLDDLFWPT